MIRKVNSKEYDYLERKRLIDSLCDEFKFVKKATIGRSCGGRDIIALKIGAASEYCLMAAAFHGSERITSTVLLMFFEELCRAIQSESSIAGLKMPRALRGRGIIIVPCINPDGCDISLLGPTACGGLKDNIAKLCKNDFTHWNANYRGVDINHNFNADWENLREKERKMGIYGPAPSRYGGAKSESEPETQALIRLCSKTRIRHTVALHSQGEVIYWNFGDHTPIRSKRIAEILATASGYALDAPIAIADGGGFKDWFIEEYNRPGFTVEIGKGKNPLPAETAEEIYINIREMLTLASII